jgi:hypothetical protein
MWLLELQCRWLWSQLCVLPVKLQSYGKLAAVGHGFSQSKPYTQVCGRCFKILSQNRTKSLLVC